MTTYHNIPLRTARNTLTNLLFQELSLEETTTDEPKLSYPISDLPVFYSLMVNHNTTTNIYILGGQEGVTYALFDSNEKQDTSSEIIPLEEVTNDLLLQLRGLLRELKGELYIPSLEEEEALGIFTRKWKRIVKITTPLITKDVVYRILASWEGANTGGKREVILNQTILLLVGVNVLLDVEFVVDSSQNDVLKEEASNKIITDYNRALGIQVKIIGAERGMKYQLLEKGTRDELSEVAIGSVGDLILNTTKEILEDSRIVVRTWRTDNVNNNEPDNGNGAPEAGDLEQELLVYVRPNPDNIIILADPVISYNGSTTVNLGDLQGTVAYQLLSKPLDLAEYQSGETSRFAELLSGDFAALSTYELGLLEPSLNLEDMDGFVPVGAAQIPIDGGTLEFETGVQQEDHVFIIKATKTSTDNDEWVYFYRTLILKVKPNPAITVTSQMNANNEWELRLNGTQKGVVYQLKTPTQAVPGFHHEERGIGGIVSRRTYGMRVGIDFGVGADTNGAFTGEELKLPLGAVTETSKFQVLAVKSYTYVSVLLTEEVVITVIK